MCSSDKEEEAKKIQAELGWEMREDSGRGWRHVVPSPKPRHVCDISLVQVLARRGTVVIAGGGSIGMMLSREIETHFSETRNQIIELDPVRARQLAQELENTDIINGDALDSAILREAGVNTTETFVAVTEDDEVNILSALLAKRTGAKHAVALVNIAGFIPLVGTLGVDAVINPSQITVSSILEHVRRGRIRDVHPIVEDLGEGSGAILQHAPLV